MTLCSGELGATVCVVFWEDGVLRKEVCRNSGVLFPSSRGCAFRQLGCRRVVVVVSFFSSSPASLGFRDRHDRPLLNLRTGLGVSSAAVVVASLWDSSFLGLTRYVGVAGSSGALTRCVAAGLAAPTLMFSFRVGRPGLLLDEPNRFEGGVASAADAADVAV